jgi:hypothetical protein
MIQRQQTQALLEAFRRIGANTTTQPLQTASHNTQNGNNDA